MNTSLQKLHTNQRLLIQELIKRGAQWEMIDNFEELILITYKDKKEYLLDRMSSKAPFHMTKVTADKFLTKNILAKNNISVPKGEVFTAKRIQEALTFAKSIYPVVIKPNWGSHGDDIQVDLRNEECLSCAIEAFVKRTGTMNAFIVEEFKPWHEHRFFITSLGEFAIVQRQPASVIGDGFQDLESLILQENVRRIQLKKDVPTSLCPIVVDDEVLRFIKQQNYNLKHIPKDGEQIFLRNESNLAKGGQAINMTDEVHPSFIDIAMRTLNSFPGLPCAGLDILANDISQPAEKSNYSIIEVNSSPGLAMHTYPSIGNSVNVAKILANVMFPNFFD